MSPDGAAEFHLKRLKNPFTIHGISESILSNSKLVMRGLFLVSPQSLTWGTFLLQKNIEDFNLVNDLWKQ